ncbi:MAG: nucleotidyl transferase AbiEii/AbiGii toxin family protein [Candidatus Aenigmarchaeota archaeon]|nr:nucleotidyl transferase AbiEii/AbiGii toxin family protein [Candidatus Aenigmarchaeota archaeon]
MMLTKIQIKKLAQKNGIPVYVQERDYIQLVFLSLLFSKTQEFIFKGGTCLRIVYNSNRYSEDLDFNFNSDRKDVLKILEAAAKDMKYFGIGAEIKEKKIWKVGIGCKLSYKGPFFDGRDITKNSIKIDVSLRKEKVETLKKLVHVEFDDIRPFIINVVTMEYVLAEKARAIITRSKARDVYDLWFLLQKGIKPDFDLINEKMKIYDEKFTKKAFKEGLKKVEKIWEKELKPLMLRIPEFRIVKKEIMLKLGN